MRYLTSLTLAALASCSLCTVQAAPPNDTLLTAQRLPASEPVNRVRGTVENAATEQYIVLEKNGQYSSRSFPHAVWYKWTAPCAGIVEVTSMASGFPVFGETFSGTGPNDLVLVAEDDLTENSVNTYTFNPTAGVTYFTAMKDTGSLHTPGAGSLFVLLHAFLAAPLSDSFAAKTQLAGTDFKIPGDNSGASKEAEEPDHAPISTRPTGKSVWMTWRSPDSRKSVTIEVQTPVFAPAVVVYTGDTLSELKALARSTVTTNRATGSTATLTFVAEDGVDYHIAVDGTRETAGGFSFSLKATTVRPGFVLQPVSTTVQRDTTALFTVAAAYTGDTVAYQWERLPAGAKQWIPLEEDATFTGTTDSILAVVASLDMNNDRYRVKVTDSVGPAYSRAAILTVTEFPALSTEVLGEIGQGSSVSLNLASGTIPAPTNGGSYFATGLPKGLSIDPATGEISGVVTAKPGTYRVTYGSTDGNKKNSPAYIVQIVVAPFSTYFQRAFEALLTSPDSLALPEGKLTVNVSAVGGFTGTYFSLDEGKAYPFRGTLDLDQDHRTASNSGGSPVSVSRGKTLPPLKLNFTLAEPSEADGQSVLTANLLSDSDVLLAETSSGVPLAVFNAARPAAWAGVYTGLLADVQRTVPSSILPIPAGDGSLLVTVTGKSGIASIRGRSAEGAPFTASLRSSDTASYRIAQRLFSGVGGQVAGSFTLVEQLISSTGAYNVPEEAGTRVYVTKPASPKDRVYPLGYETLSYLFNLEPWVKPGAGLLPARLGLADGGSVTIQIDAPGVSNTGDNERALPINFNIATNGRVISADDNTAKLALKINVANGSFAGSFIVTDPAVPPSIKPVVRKVPVSGTLMQKAIVTEGTVIGSGYLLLPPLPGQTTTTAGSFKILAGAPALPF